MSASGSIADARQHPWARDATVVVDVASLSHWLRDDLRARLRGAGHRGTLPSIPLDMMTLGWHRLVDVLEHHGVRTGRIMLAMPSGPFPPSSSGWQPIEASTGAEGYRTRERRAAIERSAALLARLQTQTSDRGVSVSELPGLFGSTGEHCVDELCVLGAAHASWNGIGDEVLVISWDADVAVAASLSGRTRIRIARSMNARDRSSLRSGTRRHRIGGNPRRLPEHLALLPETLRTLVVADDLPDGPLRTAVRSLGHEPAPSVGITMRDGVLRLCDAVDTDRILSSSLAGAPERAWIEPREAFLPLDVGTTVVVDPFGMLAAANRAGLPGRIPTARSVMAALTPLGLPGPVAQLAVIPDLLDADHGAIAIADRIGGLDLVAQVKDVLSERVRRTLIDLDEDMEAALDSYHDDALPETIATPSLFARKELARIGTSPAGLEEKESAVLLAADLLWALMHTHGMVVLMTERPDLVALLDLVEATFGADLRMRERIVRVGLHADPFASEGIAVELSGMRTPWQTSLMTGRMLADLLRLDESSDAVDDGQTPAPGLAVTDAIAYDPSSGEFHVLDMRGGRLGAARMADIVQLPVEDIALLAEEGEASAAQLRERLAASLELHLDLRRPLPRPLLAPAADDDGMVPAQMLSARIVGRGAGEVTVEVTSGARDRELLAAASPHTGISLSIGSDVVVVVEDDGRTCRLSIPDLAALPASVGRPRPARIVEQDRAVLLDPLDPLDVRDDSGARVKVLPLLGPYAAAVPGDVVLVTSVDEQRVQIVSTQLLWVDRATGDSAHAGAPR